MNFNFLATASASVLALMVPAGGALAQSSARAISPTELQQATQQHPEIVQQFGGLADPKLNAYVAGVGQRIATHTGLRDAENTYRVTVLNSPVRNAFAVPGGYVYITRELLALMNSEDELAFVLGHEMGHIAARHGQKRQSRNTLGQLGAAIASIVTGSELVGQVASQVGQGLVLSYSRSQENQSDALGVRYLAAANYDPFAAPRMLSAMGAAETLDARVAGRDQRQLPSWTSTHPLSAQRVQRTTALATQARPGATTAMTASAASRDRFFAAINGMLYGDDPQQGVIEGRQFLHPAMRFRFTAPEGYAIQNGTSAVLISGSGGQAQFGMGRHGGDLSGYVRQVFQSLTNERAQISLPAPQMTTINGMSAAIANTRARTSNGQVDVSVVAYRWSPDTAYHFIVLTPAGSGLGPFNGMIGSLAPMAQSEAAAVRPRVINVVTVGPTDTVQSLAARMAFTDHQVERFRVLNGLGPDSRLQPGQKVKLVAYGR